MAHTKSDIDAITKGFISYLEKTGQLSKLPYLAKEQVQASRTLFDPNLAFVTTVVKLQAKEIDLLKTRLEKLLDRPIKIKNQLDATIIAGLKIRVGDEIIDLSLRHQLGLLREELVQ